jgi:hypothetical protein
MAVLMQEGVDRWDFKCMELHREKVVLGGKHISQQHTRSSTYLGVAGCGWLLLGLIMA